MSFDGAIEVGTPDDATERKPTMTAEGATAAASMLYGTSAKEILSHTRRAPVVRARWAAWWILRQNGWTLDAIGAAFNRDHTTVMHAMQKMEAER